ncbi:MAG: S-ribosylhomocysteine lyase [Clostridia bacterium]|nr:S-ribosylhomocysteine lyase [Clostridia bacterium]
MERIASFSVDHTKLDEGIYISRIDGDITTYDLRMRKPNTGDLISVSAMHSMEHMFATVVRNSEMSDKVIYFGPMGCQTGFYLLMRTKDHGAVVELIKKVLRDIIVYDGEMPGCSEIECGNYRSLSMEAAKSEAEMYIEKIKDWSDKMLEYK